MKKAFAALAVIIVVALGAGATYFFLQPPAPDLETLEAEYVGEHDRFIDVDGLRVRVREQGPADAPLVLLMHGFIYSLETWDAWADALSTDYRVVSFDLAGHGLTGPDPEQRYSPDERAAFVGDVLDALEAETAVIAGNSLGGLAAWKFAAAEPGRVSALILVAPGAYPLNGVGDAPAAAPAAMRLFLTNPNDLALRATLERIFANDALVTDARIKRLGDMMQREGNGEAFVQSIEEFALPDPSEALASIAAPTLIMWGAEDIVIPAEHADRLVAAIPGAALVRYEDTGHVPQEEAAAQSAADVKAFLDSLDLGRP